MSARTERGRDILRKGKREGGEKCKKGRQSESERERERNQRKRDRGRESDTVRECKLFSLVQSETFHQLVPYFRTADTPSPSQKLLVY